LARKIKELICKELEEHYRDTRNAVVVAYQGIDAPSADKIRRALREKEIELRVIKNSLAHLAFEKIGLGDLSRFLDQPVALARGGKDPVALAKAIAECAKEYEPLVIRGGLYEGKVVSAEEIGTMAEIPPVEVLYARMLAGVASPITRTAMAINGVLQKLAIAVKEAGQKLPAGEEKAEAAPAEGAPEEKQPPVEQQAQPAPAANPEKKEEQTDQQSQ